MIIAAVPISALPLATRWTSARPGAVMYAVDCCSFCHMPITDPRLAGAIVTKLGRTIKFGSIECLAAFYRQTRATRGIASVWIADFRRPSSMIDAVTARYVHVPAGVATVGAEWVAVGSLSDAAALGVSDAGAVKGWIDLQ